MADTEHYRGAGQLDDVAGEQRRCDLALMLELSLSGVQKALPWGRNRGQGCRFSSYPCTPWASQKHSSYHRPIDRRIQRV